MKTCTRLLAIVVLMGLMGGTSALADDGGPSVYGLQCEYRTNPWGIDAAQPRLTWFLDGGGRGLKQTAYQVLVASTREGLAADKGDRWDSGKVQSEQSTQLEYAGKALASHEVCWWKVRIWDEADKASAWSEAAQWTMGMLRAEDWTAKWIGLDRGEHPDGIAQTLGAAKWIWFPEGAPESNAPVGARFFRYVLEIPGGRVVRRAAFYVSADNDATVFVNGVNAGQATDFKSVHEITLTDRLQPGANVLALAAHNSGDAPNPAGVIGAIRVEFVSGEPLVVVTDGKWKVSNKENPNWNKADATESGWEAARELGAIGMQPWGTLRQPEDRVLAARMLRHEFDLAEQVKRATAYISGLGLFELYLNGQRVGDQVLAPGLTEYKKRSFYMAFDVTDRVKSGANAVGVWLGNGRYFSPRETAPTKTGTYGYPKALFQLRLEMADGSVKDVSSDETWKLTTQGPIRANNEYDGETYDARLEAPGWSAPGFDDSKWEAAQLVEKPSENLSAQMAEPIKVMDTLHPVTLSSPQPGKYIFDMGQNMVGWCRLRVAGPAGTRVALRHAEVLKDDGTLYLDNIRGAKVTDEYILKGTGAEVYEPRFTYHGFRYVELTGFPGQPDLSTIEGCVIHDAVRTAGSFECSNELLNRIYHNVVWGVRGNYRSIPTDCPQRDERQGWLGDRSEESRGESYLYDISAFYAKWVADIEDAQRADGSVSDVCPSYWAMYNDNVTWPSSFIIIPGMLYQQYGDKTVLKKHYPAMKKWVLYMTKYLQDDIMPKDNYGDWCVPPEEQHLIHSKDPARKTSGDFLGTAYFFYDAQLMAQYADTLGFADDAKEFRAMAERLHAAFNKKFLNADTGIYANGAATSSVLPLAFGLAPKDARERVFQNLVNKVMVENKGHTSTGLIGGQFLMRALTNNGRADVAYTIASQSDYPSWGYMVKKNATTIWELWNGDTADPAMNSHNHVMLVGDLTTWLYENLAGIKPDSPGAQRLVMRPCPVPGLDYVKASWRSPHGQIFSRWTHKDGKLTWEITLPGNVSATVYVPAKDPGSVQEGDQPAAQSKGVKAADVEANAAAFTIGSGTYVFKSAY